MRQTSCVIRRFTFDVPGCFLTTPEVTVACASWRDVMALWRLERACFPQEAYDPLTLLLLVVWPGNVTLKATVGNDLIGFVAGDEPWGEQAAWVVTLGVAPQHRRRGVGARLLAECEARLRRPVVRLMVREGNAPAIALYRKSGYVQVRRQAHYYNDGEAGLLMEKNRGA